MNTELRDQLLLMMDGLLKLEEDRFQNLILFCAQKGLAHFFRDWVAGQMNTEQRETLDGELSDIILDLEQKEENEDSAEK